METQDGDGRVMPPRTDAGLDDRIAALAVELGLEQPVVTLLPGGVFNRTLRLQDGHRDLVLRLAGAGTRSLGVDWHAELAVQQLAAGAGLAPAVVLARPDEGLLVMRHVAGRVLCREDARQPLMLARIGAWFARLHALAPPAGFAPVDIAARAAGYLQLLGASDPATLLRDLGQRLERLRAQLSPPARLAACHHDLHHLNLMDAGDALVALDWEYAGAGDPVADLAAFASYHELDSRQIKILLGACGADTQRHAARLDPLIWVFDCLCYGWMEVVAAQGIAADPERRRGLIERLSG